VTFRVLITGTDVLILVGKPCASLLTCMVICLSLSACVNGIPPPDGWAPPKVKPCHVVVIQRDDHVCMTRWEFTEWRRVNSL
jgi:hypothetical protein